MYLTALQFVETVAPTVEPVTTAQVKTALRIDTSSEDTFLDTLIVAARQHVEAVTGRALVERTLRWDVRYWANEVILLKPPLVSVTSITYRDVDNAEQTWAASNYEVDAKGGRILLSSTGTIPSSFDRYDAWQLTAQHGYDADNVSPASATGAVPEAIRSAIKLIVGDLYENREATTPFKIHANKTVDMLLASYRTRV